MPPAKNMKSALGASLRAEEQAVKNRFEKAETALARDEPVAGAAAPPPEAAGPAPERVKRDSFTMPLPDYERIGRIQERCLQAGLRANKSEVLRAGLAALDAMTEEELTDIVRRLDRVKTGRRPLQSMQRV